MSLNVEEIAEEIAAIANGLYTIRVSGKDVILLSKVLCKLEELYGQLKGLQS